MPSPVFKVFPCRYWWIGRAGPSQRAAPIEIFCFGFIRKVLKIQFGNTQSKDNTKIQIFRFLEKLLKMQFGKYSLETQSQMTTPVKMICFGFIELHWE